MAGKHSLPFDMLVDEGNRVAGEYGLVYEVPDYLREIYQSFGVDLAETNADGAWTLPIPARYIIDGAGTVRYAETSVDYTVRPDPSHTVDALRQLVS